MKLAFIAVFLFLGLGIQSKCSIAGIRDRLSIRRLVDHFLLYPSRNPVPWRGSERIMLSSGTEIWIHRRKSRNTSPDEKTEKIYILHFIGNAARAENDFPILLHLLPDYIEAEVWSVNYPGFGRSRGRARLDAIPGVALDAYQNLLRRVESHDSNERTPPIYLSGFSLGSTAALYLATCRPARGLILHNPPPIQKIIEGEYGWWNAGVLAKVFSSRVPSELDSYKNAAESTIPALFLNSEKDEIVPLMYQKEVIARYAGKKNAILFPDAGHGSLIPYSSTPQVQEGAAWLIYEGQSLK
jgi:pimeloyl-ACP methyl ester carboxylesterase